MKNFFKITTGKFSLFIVLFLLTLALPIPMEFGMPGFNSAGSQPTPIFFLYFILIVFGFSAGFNFEMFKMLALSLIPHIVIVYFVTCVISALYRKFKGNKGGNEINS